jgi:hypothetical protein
MEAIAGADSSWYSPAPRFLLKSNI